MPLYITYDNQSLVDGFGAQGLRLLGIFSMARFFRVKYLHSPIVNLDFQPTYFNLDNVEKEQALNQVNSFFHFPSDRGPNKVELVLNRRSIGLREMTWLVLRYKFSRKTALLRLLLPFGITDRLPALYKFGIRQIRKQNQDIFASWPVTDIVIHIRLGPYSGKDYLNSRFLPLEYYDSVLDYLASTYDLKMKAIVIHTDIQKIKGDGAPGKIDLFSGISSAPNRIVTVKNQAPLFSTFLDMCNAKNLVISKSALSYLAGLINSNEVICPKIHGHTPLRKWTLFPNDSICP